MQAVLVHQRVFRIALNVLVCFLTRLLLRYIQGRYLPLDLIALQRTPHDAHSLECICVLFNFYSAGPSSRQPHRTVSPTICSTLRRSHRPRLHYINSMHNCAIVAAYCGYERPPEAGVGAMLPISLSAPKRLPAVAVPPTTTSYRQKTTFESCSLATYPSVGHRLIRSHIGIHIHKHSLHCPLRRSAPSRRSLRSVILHSPRNSTSIFKGWQGGSRWRGDHLRIK